VQTTCSICFTGGPTAVGPAQRTGSRKG